MKGKWTLVGTIMAVLMMAVAAGLTQAQGSEPPGKGVGPQGGEAIAAVGPYVPVQGRLTDESGNPLDGTFNNITLRIYETGSGGTALCEVTPASLNVSNGLFSTYIPCSSGVIDGRQLYLAVKVGGDGEMTPRQPIYPVPYAFSLKPGARIYDNSDQRVLMVHNDGSGAGVYGYSLTGEGLYGWGEAGRGVYGYSYSGVGVYAESATSVTIQAAGTGVIQSTAATDWVVSPLKIVPGDASGDGDLRIVHSSQFGWVVLYTDGADNCTALLPVDIVALLFGTRVKVSSFHFCYSMADANLDDYIDQVDIEYVKVDGGHQNLCSFTNDVSSTAWTCQTCTPASPAGIYGPVFVRFKLHFTGDGSDHRIRLGHMYLHLTE